MNVWDYSIQNAPHFKGCNSYHVFDWGFQKDCFKPYWKEDAGRGIAFYGGASDRRSDLLKQLANHVDIVSFTQNGVTNYSKMFLTTVLSCPLEVHQPQMF